MSRVVGEHYIDGDGEVWKYGATGAEDTFVAASEFVYENGEVCPYDDAYHLRNAIYGNIICGGCGAEWPSGGDHPPVEEDEGPWPRDCKHEGCENDATSALENGYCPDHEQEG